MAFEGKKKESARDGGVCIENYLKETPMLDFSSPAMAALVEERGWRALSEYEKIRTIYGFVRDEILFGYNVSDGIPASRVLRDGYGQCNTKGTLFTALLRGVGVPCRVHGFTIDKKLQKGAMTGIVYKNAPQNIFHSWVEVFYDGTWRKLEGFILDKRYLTALQNKFSSCDGPFCGYGVAVKDFRNPPVEWRGGDTYIQSEGINNDFGVYDSPDELLREHGQEMSKFKELLYRCVGRRRMNRNVKSVREGK